MPLELITPPAVLPVTLDEAKDFMRVLHDDEDALIEALIHAATERYDGRDGTLGPLITQTWRITADRFPAEIMLPLPPCQSVVSITYIDTAGTAQTLAADAYEVLGIGGLNPAHIRPAYGTAWPDTRYTPGAVVITFTCGYGDAPDTVPETIRLAIKQFVATGYEQREHLAADAVTLVPTMGDDLVRNHRQWVF